MKSSPSIIIALFAVQAIFGFIRTYFLTYAGERIVADLRVQLYSHLIHLPLTFFDNRRTGELTSRLASDVTVIQSATESNIDTDSSAPSPVRCRTIKASRMAS